MKKIISVIMILTMLCTLVLSVSAVRDIDYQDYNLINIYQKSAPAILDGRMTAEDGYGAPLATITLEQFFDNWGIDTDPGYENINSDTDIIPQQVDIYGFYTAENFYYCLVIRDLVHYNNGHENLYSGGDSVFFNMVGDREATDDSSRYRYCMRITNDGVADVFNYSENVSNEITGYEDWKVTRDEPSKITTYEIVVPFDDILEDTTIDVGDWFYFQEGLELSKSEEYANDHCMTTLPGKATTRNWWKMTFAGEAPAPVVEEPAPEAAEEAAAETGAEEVTEVIAAVTPVTADGMALVSVMAVLSLAAVVVLKKRA